MSGLSLGDGQGSDQQQQQAAGGSSSIYTAANSYQQQQQQQQQRGEYRGEQQQQQQQAPSTPSHGFAMQSDDFPALPGSGPAGSQQQQQQQLRGGYGLQQQQVCAHCILYMYIHIRHICAISLCNYRMKRDVASQTDAKCSFSTVLSKVLSTVCSSSKGACLCYVLMELD
jgi:hypothetical protein